MNSAPVIRRFASADREQWLQLPACLSPDRLEDPQAEEQATAWRGRSPVDFPEGWFVREPQRRQEWGAALVRDRKPLTPVIEVRLA